MPSNPTFERTNARKQQSRGLAVESYVSGPGSVKEKLARIDKDLSWGFHPKGVYEATRDRIEASAQRPGGSVRLSRMAD